MIRAILLIGGLGLVAAIALAVAAFSYFGVMGAAGVGAAALVAIPLAIRRLGGRLPGQARGQPLRDARVRVHAVRRATPPPADPEDDEDPDSREWYMIELTIVPGAAPASSGLWDPTALVLVAPDDDPDDPDPRHAWGHVARARVWRDGAWQPVEKGLAVVETRVRLLAGLRPGLPPALRFRYYMEVFGHLDMARSKRASGV